MNIPKYNITHILNAMNRLLEYKLPNDKRQYLIKMYNKILYYKNDLDYEKDTIFSRYGIEIIGDKKIKIENKENISRFLADIKEISQGIANIDIVPLGINKITLDNKTIPINEMYALYGIIKFE